MFQEALMEYLPVISHAIMRSLVLFVIALGVVYMTGRMLGIFHTYRTKNSIALITIIILAYWSVHIYDLELIVHPHEIYWRTIVYSSLSSIFYVLAGFDLYDRFNDWCDYRFKKEDTKKKRKDK